MPCQDHESRELLDELRRDLDANRVMLRRERRIAVALIGGVMMIVGMTGAFKSERTEIIEVGTLRVTDKEGKVRAEITYDDLHDSTLKLYDREGNPRLCLQVMKDVVKFNFRESNGKFRMSIVAMKDEDSSLSLFDQTGKERISLTAENPSSLITVNSPDGEPAIALGTSAVGSKLWFLDGQGKERMNMALKPDAGVAIALSDKDEQPRLHLSHKNDGSSVIGFFGRDQGPSRVTLRHKSDGTAGLSIGGGRDTESSLTLERSDDGSTGLTIFDSKDANRISLQLDPKNTTQFELKDPTGKTILRMP